MALSASIALSSSSVGIGKAVTATLTVTNSAASAVNMLSIVPYAFKTGDSVDDGAPVTLGVAPLTAGNTVSVPGSSSLDFKFQVIPNKSSDTGTYSIGAYCYAQDGSMFKPTVATLTAYGFVQEGYASVNQSTLAVGSATVAHGSSTSVTLTLKDSANVALNYPASNQCKIYIVPGSGTSVGSVTQTVDNRDGTFSATFLATTAGTALTICGTINGKVIKTSLPTITVT